MPNAFAVTEADRARPLNVVGERITVLADGARTSGYEIFHQTGPEGSGPPPHSHDWDESFYVTKGEIEFGWDGDKHIVGKPGTLVHLPAGTVHWFRFGKGGGEAISMTSFAGAAKFFTDVDAEIAPEKPDLGKLVEVATRHGLKVSAPSG